jgi:hypothetical protein
MTNKQPTYHSYLLRLWREEHGGQFIWRASLEIPGDEKRRAFADLAALFGFLAAETAATGPAEGADDVPARVDDNRSTT